MKVLVFGGSFDPVHLGHEAMVDAAREALHPDLVFWVPARQAPHKLDHDPAPAEDRVAFLERVLTHRPGERLCRFELDRPPPSYTVDTLEELHRRWPGAEAWFLMGADSLTHLGTWHDLPRLFELTGFVFVPRDGWGRTQLDAFRRGLPSALRRRFRTRFLDVDLPAYSSTAIRAALARGEEPAGLRPEVLEEVLCRGDYGAAPRGGSRPPT